jgi:signal transduction histidine kinase
MRRQDIRDEGTFWGKKYVISFFTVLIFSFFQYLLWPYIGPAPFLLLYPAIIISALYGDGNLAIIMSAILGQHYFIPPFGEFIMEWPQDYVRLVTFLITSVMIKKIINNEIVARKKAQKSEALSLQREVELRKEQAARDRFVSMLNHDLRNPLTAIKMSAELIEKKSSETLIIERHIKKQLSNIKRMEEMIHDLLDANKIHAGHVLTVKFERAEIKAIIEEVINDLRLIFGERFFIHGEGTYVGHWSPGSIKRILDNLCTNAVKYGKETSPIIISYQESKEGISISVKNEGNPISENDIRRLFNPYQQLDTNKQGSDGWGIGLTLVKGLVEAHKGELTVKSDETGTVFTFTLPYEPEKKEHQNHSLEP